MAFRLEGTERSSFPELQDELQELASLAQVCVPVESGFVGVRELCTQHQVKAAHLPASLRVWPIG